MEPLAVPSFRTMVLLWADLLANYAIWIMQTYLTEVWKLSLTHAAGILNIWGGTARVMLLPFRFLADTLLGNYLMLLISSAAYATGLMLLYMSTPPVLAKFTGTCRHYEPACIGHTQKVLFYVALALIVVGLSGHITSLESFQAEQIKGHDSQVSGGRLRVLLKMAGFSLFILVPIIGGIILPFVKPWSIRFLIPAVVTILATLAFVSGSCSYTMLNPRRSPLTNVCRVLVASTSKICQQFPSDANELYGANEHYVPSVSRTLFNLRLLDKAAIILPDIHLQEQERHKWTLCTVSEVEEAKLVIGMIPMSLTFVFCGMVSSFGNTYFIEQANNMNRSIGKWRVPLPSLLLLFDLAKFVLGKLHAIMVKHLPTRSKKYALPIGIAMAIMFSIVCCLTAASVEIRRLRVIRKQGLLNKPEDEIPMSMFWLVPQFVLLAGLDSFLEGSVADFFNDQAPVAMRNYLQFFTHGVSGLGFMANVLSVYVVGKAKSEWFRFTLNKSRLDRYYWVLAALSSINLILYATLSFCYRFKEQIISTDEQRSEYEESERPYDDNAHCCLCRG